MKVPARRRGNGSIAPGETITVGLNESPRPKAGKCFYRLYQGFHSVASMKVPARRRGNGVPPGACFPRPFASMKVPARRRGNPATFFNGSLGSGLNESPRPKAGKLKPLEAISELVSLNESPRPKAGKSMQCGVLIGILILPQ